MKQRYTCYLSMGANLGTREQTLCRALELLGEADGVRLECVSGIYETEPWGHRDQPGFLNLALRLQTHLSPLQLLDCCQQIEARLGRERREKWGPRTIDIDLLYIPGVHLDTERLTLPHPYMFQRSFVLVPLEEIAGKEAFESRSLADWLQACTDTGGIQRIKDRPFYGDFAEI